MNITICKSSYMNLEGCLSMIPPLHAETEAPDNPSNRKIRRVASTTWIRSKTMQDKSTLSTASIIRWENKVVGSPSKTMRTGFRPSHAPRIQRQQHFASHSRSDCLRNPTSSWELRNSKLNMRIGIKTMPYWELHVSVLLQLKCFKEAKF